MNNKLKDSSKQKNMFLSVGSTAGLRYAMMLYLLDKNIRDLVRNIFGFWINKGKQKED